MIVQPLMKRLRHRDEGVVNENSAYVVERHASACLRTMGVDKRLWKRYNGEVVIEKFFFDVYES